MFSNNDNLDSKLNELASRVIKEKRIKSGLSLEDLANKLNNIVTRQSLYRYENSEARMKVGIFNKICLALNEDPNKVWQEINERFLNRTCLTHPSTVGDKTISDDDLEKLLKEIDKKEGIRIIFDKEGELTEEELNQIVNHAKFIKSQHHKDDDE